MDHQSVPEAGTHDEDFILLPEYTACGKNHTYHSESWPTSGAIVIEKCERQCRFRGCKAWSQTAAALRKHVNKHIQHNNLPLKIVPASSGRTPLKIIVVQDFGSTPYDNLDSLASAAAQDAESLQQTSTRPVRPLSPFTAIDSSSRTTQREEVDKQHSAIGTSTSTADDSIHDFHLFGTGPMIHIQNEPGYDSMRPPMESTIHESQGFTPDNLASKQTSMQSSFQDPWTSPLATRPTSPPQLLGCPDCKMVLKTRIEQKKHVLRHRKPYSCHHPECTRTDGFSTSKDLVRHLQSGHTILLRDSAPTISYRCFVAGCKSKEKSWPRMDNFRSHLERTHSQVLQTEEQLEAYTNRGKMVGDNGTMPGNGADLQPLHVLADSAASIR